MTSRRFAITFWERPIGYVTGKEVQYFVSSMELCPTTKKQHWQSYLETHKPMRISQVRKLWPQACKMGQVTICKGTGDQNKVYCLKDESNDWEEIGEMGPGQGARTDLVGITKRMRDENMTLAQVQEEAPQLAMQYRNGFRDMEDNRQHKHSKTLGSAEWTDVKCKDWEAMVLKAREYPDAFIMDTKYWYFDSYRGEDTIVILGSQYFDKVLIKHPIHLPLPTKYRTAYPNWTHVVHITQAETPVKVNYAGGVDLIPSQGSVTR